MPGKEATCAFHGIGQGLFYSCVIESEADVQSCFRFVYDCGTFYKKDAQLLEEEIANCFHFSAFELEHDRHDDRPVIDALFISHFDYDHISGVPYLLKHYQVRSVFIPYLTPEIMHLLELKAIEEGWSDEDLQLFQDPFRYFSAHGCEAVFVIGALPSSDDRIIKEYDERQFRWRTEEFSFRDGVVVRHDAIHGGITETAQYDCSSALTVRTYRADWEFRIYQDQPKEEQNKIADEIKKSLGNRSLDKLFTQTPQGKALLKDIKQLYQKVKNGINQSSMVLYHAPNANWASVCFSRKPCSCYYRVNVCPNYDFFAGSLLTGDIDTNKLREQGSRFLEYMGNLPIPVGFLQLPHHGSGHNLDLTLLAKFMEPQYAVFVCSYGIGNHFRHPDPHMLDQLESHRLAGQTAYQINHVYQGKDFTYTIETA